jgi:protein O-mannosyl-transferase
LASRRSRSSEHGKGVETPRAAPRTALARPPRIPAWAVIATIAVTFAAYSAAFTAPFVFDDAANIPDNPSIQRLWPPSVPLSPPPNIGVSERPIVNYSFALNYALNDWLGVDQRPDPYGRYKTVSYHIVNVALHLVCGFLLFGIIRRTLRLKGFATDWAATADSAAAIVAGLWLLHPIQTEAIDYMTQRTEIMVSAFYLGTLYAWIRSWDAKDSRRTARWCATAVALCLLGMGSKEVMISAPLMVVLYDRAFRFNSWRDLFDAPRMRRWAYAGLVATSVWAIVLIAGGSRTRSTVGFHLGMTWYDYVYTQSWAIPHYVRLALWPDRLTLDYGQKPIGGLTPIPGLILMVALGVATIAAWMRAEEWGWFGFLGAWFFLILAPSSSFVPIRTEIAAERRIYLAFASILVLLPIATETVRRRLASRSTRWSGALAISLSGVTLFYLIVSRWRAQQIATTIAAAGPASAAVLAWVIRIGIASFAAALLWALIASRRRAWVPGVVVALLGAATFARGTTYRDEENLWRDVVLKRPDNPRGYNNLAAALLDRNPPRTVEAEALLRHAIALDSTYLDPWNTLAEIDVRRGQLSDARALLERALAIDSNYVEGGEQLGNILVRQGQPEAAIPILERIAAHFPNDECFVALGTAYLGAGRVADATQALLRAIALKPSRADALRYLGASLMQQNRAQEAVVYLEDAVRHDPASAEGFAMLSLAYALTGRADEAVQASASAESRGGGDPDVNFLAGRAMVVLGRRDDAVRLFRRALEVSPGFAPAAQALSQLGVGRG